MTNNPAPGAATRAHGIASLVEQTARAVQDLCWTGDMQAVQWSALRYFAAAGAQARSVIGLAKFHGTNPGTASRMIAVLVRRGLIDVAVDPKDKRSRIVTLTQAGRDLLAQDPLRNVEAAVAAMPPEVQSGLATGLRELLGSLLAVPADGSAAAQSASDD